jgi:hypothetical protein
VAIGDRDQDDFIPQEEDLYDDQDAEDSEDFSDDYEEPAYDDLDFDVDSAELLRRNPPHEPELGELND